MGLGLLHGLWPVGRRIKEDYTMELKLSTEAQAGYDYVAAKEGKTAATLIAERAETQGLWFFEDKRRGEFQDLLHKIEKNPDAYKASISAIAAVEDQKEADAIALKEAEEIELDVKGA